MATATGGYGMAASTEPAAGANGVASFAAACAGVASTTARARSSRCAFMLRTVTDWPPGPGATPTAIDFSAGELRLKGLRLRPEEIEAIAFKLKPQAYALSAEADSLVVRQVSAP